MLPALSQSLSSRYGYAFRYIRVVVLVTAAAAETCQSVLHYGIFCCRCRKMPSVHTLTHTHTHRRTHCRCRFVCTSFHSKDIYFGQFMHNNFYFTSQLDQLKWIDWKKNATFRGHNSFRFFETILFTNTESVWLVEMMAWSSGFSTAIEC